LLSKGALKKARGGLTWKIVNAQILEIRLCCVFIYSWGVFSMPIDEKALSGKIMELSLLYHHQHQKGDSAERKTEDFLRELFVFLGWDWLSEVTPQKKVKALGRTTRVDFSFRGTGKLRPDFYVEVKRFSDKLDSPEHERQVIGYGKNSRTRWVVLTNFTKWKVFNSDYFDEPHNAKLFEFTIEECTGDDEQMRRLLLFAKENGGGALDAYAKKHEKWKESEDIEDLLTEQLQEARDKLNRAIVEQNHDLFDPEPENDDLKIDSCVQNIFDRIIFCRMLDDNGADPDRKMSDVFEKWKEDKRVQFYRDFLCPFWAKMRAKYDSTIFDNHRIDGLALKNDDFVPVFESFIIHPKTKLPYMFEAIGTDVLGHAYENYLSFKTKQTAKRTGLEKEQFKRKQSGIYYTPEFLVEYLVHSAVGEKLKGCKTPSDALKIRVLDPSCGSGTFLVCALDEFKKWFMDYENGGGTDSSVSDFVRAAIEKCIYGIDLDPRAVRLAKLNLFLRAADSPHVLPKPNVIQKNSLVSDDDVPKSFKFERDFPLVHEAGGFDVIIGNPPWERWELKSQEFFEKHSPGFGNLGKQEAIKKMDEIMRTRPYVKKEWLSKQMEYEMMSDIFKKAYSFQSANTGKPMSGHTDLYKLFTERAYQLLKDGGLAGLVVPSGIYTDLGCKGLRGMLFDNCRTRHLYSFENKGHAIFADVHASYKFVLLAFEKGGKTGKFPCAFFLHTQDDLKKASDSPTLLDVDFVRKSSPISHSIVEIKSAKDREIVNKLLAFPKLGEKPWELKPFQGFNMTIDSKLFQTGKLGVPLLEGKNIHQFTHKWKEAPETRFTVTEKDIVANLKAEKLYHNKYWIGYRLIASSTNERTLISTLVPPGFVCGHSMAVILDGDVKQMAYLVGMMNSFVLDYLVRQKMSININFNFFLEFPVPAPETDREAFDFIVRKVAQLVCTTNEFSELKKAAGIEHALVNESDRAQARAQLDARIAKLYGITKDELAYILEKFPISDQKQKEMVLAGY